MLKASLDCQLIVKPKAELNRHLPIVDGVIGNVAACFDYLEPVDIVKCLASLCDGVLHGFFDAFLG